MSIHFTSGLAWHNAAKCTWQCPVRVYVDGLYSFTIADAFGGSLRHATDCAEHLAVLLNRGASGVDEDRLVVWLQATRNSPRGVGP
jgi:hypothetical protein